MQEKYLLLKELFNEIRLVIQEERQVNRECICHFEERSEATEC